MKKFGFPIFRVIQIHENDIIATGLQPNLAATEQSADGCKLMRNGQIYIRKDGMIYDILGRKVQ